MGLFSSLLSPITRILGGSSSSSTTQTSTSVIPSSTQTVTVDVSPHTTVESQIDILFDFEELGQALESWALNEKEIEDLKTKTGFFLGAAELELQHEAIDASKALSSFLMSSENKKIYLEGNIKKEEKIIVEYYLEKYKDDGSRITNEYYINPTMKDNEEVKAINQLEQKKINIMIICIVSIIIVIFGISIYFGIKFYKNLLKDDDEKEKVYK